MNSKLGTNWVAPGDGATVAELAVAFGRPAPPTHLANRKTSLALTGRPLRVYDCERLRVAVAEAMQTAEYQRLLR